MNSPRITQSNPPIGSNSCSVNQRTDSNVRHRILALRQFLWLLIPICHAVTAFAQVNTFSNSNEALSALFPNEKVFEWETTKGDFNGDGFEDLAVILVHNRADEPLDTRLVVLAGAPDGRYSPLSVSTKYCDVQKFYGLQTKGTSLFVTEVHKADGTGEITNTLQFRFNKSINDFELIGRENLYRSYQDNSYGRTSVNYSTGLSIDYARPTKRIKPNSRVRFAVQPLARLNGFNCGKYIEGNPY